MPTYRTYTHADPFAPKRWAHQRRFVDALAVLPSAPASLLDYGTGDGILLKRAAEQFPHARLVGFEPLKNMAEQAREELRGLPVVIAESMEELRNQRFEAITCLETCEHLVPEALDELCQNIQALLKPNGTVVISAPIELGPVSLVKNIFRLLRRKRYENLSLKNIFLACIGIAPKQYVNHVLGHPYIFSHVGFDHRQLIRTLRNYFTIERIQPTPWPRLGNWLNPTIMIIGTTKFQ